MDPNIHLSDVEKIRIRVLIYYSELGSAMTATRVRSWCLTLNNPTDEEVNHLRGLNERLFKCAIFAHEIGESETPHIQGFVQFVNARTLTACKKILGTARVHLEAANGTPYEAYNYCMKEDGEIFTFGDEPAEVELSDWERILIAVENGESDLDIIRKWPAIAMRCQTAIAKYRAIYQASVVQWRDVDVQYLWGATGTGKTRGVLYDAHGNYNQDVYRATNAKNPFDMYNGESTIVFEEFRSQFTCRDMLNWIDGHPVMLPARYADRMAQFTTVYILSNWSFDEQYKTVRDTSPATYAAWARRVTSIVEITEEPTV